MLTDEALRAVELATHLPATQIAQVLDAVAGEINKASDGGVYLSEAIMIIHGVSKDFRKFEEKA